MQRNPGQAHGPPVDLDPVKGSPGKWRLNLYDLEPDNGTSLALGTLELTSFGDNKYAIDNEDYDFDIKNNMTTARDWATAGSVTLHYAVFGLSPLIWGGSFTIKFHGTITIDP